MGVAILGSRRSGTTLLQSLVLDLILKGKVAEKARYVLEPYYWQTEIEHPGAKNLVPHERCLDRWKRHLATPIYIEDPDYQDTFLNQLLRTRDGLFPVVKFTLALGRCLPLVEMPHVKVVYIVRDPVGVLASIHQQVFDLGEVDVGHGSKWPPQVSDWKHFYPQLPIGDRILRNALRWMKENSFAFEILRKRANAFVLTFAELEERPVETVAALAKFLGADLGPVILKRIAAIKKRTVLHTLPASEHEKAALVQPLYRAIVRYCAQFRARVA